MIGMIASVRVSFTMVAISNVFAPGCMPSHAAAAAVTEEVSLTAVPAKRPKPSFVRPSAPPRDNGNCLCDFFVVGVNNRGCCRNGRTAADGGTNADEDGAVFIHMHQAMQDIRYDEGCSNGGNDDGQRSCANHCNLRQVQPETKQNNCILQNLFGCVLNPFLKDTLLTEDLCEDHPKNDGKNGSTNHRKLMP